MREYAVAVNYGSKAKVLETLSATRTKLIQLLREVGFDTAKGKFIVVDNQGKTVATCTGESAWKLSLRKAGSGAPYFYTPFTIRIRGTAAKSFEFPREGNQQFVVTTGKPTAL